MEMLIAICWLNFEQVFWVQQTNVVYQLDHKIDTHKKKQGRSPMTLRNMRWLLGRIVFGWSLTFRVWRGPSRMIALIIVFMFHLFLIYFPLKKIHHWISIVCCLYKLWGFYFVFVFSFNFFTKFGHGEAVTLQGGYANRFDGKLSCLPPDSRILPSSSSWMLPLDLILAL